MLKMPVELVRTTTSDEVQLDGAFYSPGRISSPRMSIDAVICLHGAGGNFYSSTLLTDVTNALRENGVAVLRVNTRGHDGMNSVRVGQKARRQGAALETVDDCRYDVRSWIDLMMQRGYRSISLLGHSLGALKALYAQAKEAHPGITNIVAISPPRLAFRNFLDSSDSLRFQHDYDAAARLVDSAKGDTLLEVSCPISMIISAAAYLDKYGPEEKYDLLKFVGRISCPMLFTFGSLELESGAAAFTGLRDAIEELGNLGAPIHCTTVQRANHFYDGTRERLCDELVGWLQNA